LGEVFRPAPGVPKLPFAIILPLVVFLLVLLRSRRLGAALDAAPLSWLVGLQLYRVFGSAILAAWSRGDLAFVFALPPGLGDIPPGALALPVAYLLYRGAPGARAAAVAWNLLGIIDLVDAVAIGFLSAPGPLQLIVPNPPNAALGVFPTVLIPAF